ncbi:MAG TPA: hypothetical protein VKV57_01585 [bacterium]|nr:hypothetical protein [bacterium]
MGPGAKVPLDQLNIGSRHWDGISQMSAFATSIDAFRSRIKQGLNVLEGPGGAHFDRRAGNPSEGIDTQGLPLGIIPALGQRVAEKDPYAEDALTFTLLARELAVRSLAETDVRAIQRLAKAISLLVEAALSLYP